MTSVPQSLVRCTSYWVTSELNRCFSRALHPVMYNTYREDSLVQHSVQRTTDGSTNHPRQMKTCSLKTYSPDLHDGARGSLRIVCVHSGQSTSLKPFCWSTIVRISSNSNPCSSPDCPWYERGSRKALPPHPGPKLQINCGALRCRMVACLAFDLSCCFGFPRPSNLRSKVLRLFFFCSPIHNLKLCWACTF